MNGEEVIMNNRYGRSRSINYSFFTLRYSLLIVILLTISMAGCGYYNPYVTREGESLPTINLYVDIWPNRTNELGLETKLYRRLITWFKKSTHIKATQDRQKSEYLLTGEIRSINVPSLSYGQFDQAVELNVTLTVHYAMQKEESGEILWEQTQSFQEAVSVTPDAVSTRDNKQKALAIINDDLAEIIYLRILNTIRSI